MERRLMWCVFARFPQTWLHGLPDEDLCKNVVFLHLYMHCAKGGCGLRVPRLREGVCCIYTCTVPRTCANVVFSASIQKTCARGVFFRLNACTVNLLVSYVRSKRMHAIQHLHDLGRAHLLPAFRADADNVLNVLLR